MSDNSQGESLRGEMILGKEEWERSKLEIEEISAGLNRLADPGTCAERTGAALRCPLDEAAQLLGVQVEDDGHAEMFLRLKCQESQIATFKVSFSISPDLLKDKLTALKVTTFFYVAGPEERDAEYRLSGLGAVILAVPFVRRHLLAFLQKVRDCAWKTWGEKQDTSHA